MVSKTFFLSSLRKWQRKRKRWVDSFSEPQSHTTITVSLKLCQSLRSFKWLKPKLSLVNNFIPIGSCIKKTEELFTFIKLSSSDSDSSLDSAFLVMLSNFFHSLIQHGKNECLKFLALEEMILRVSFCHDLAL